MFGRVLCEGGVAAGGHAVGEGDSAEDVAGGGGRGDGGDDGYGGAGLGGEQGDDGDGAEAVGVGTEVWG